MSNFLPHLTDSLRAQALREMLRIRQKSRLTRSVLKVTPISYSAEAKMGRPLQSPARSFTARMLEKLKGMSHKRALEIIDSDPDSVPGSLWALGAEASSAGITDLEGFDRWVKRALSDYFRTKAL